MLVHPLDQLQVSFEIHRLAANELGFPLFPQGCVFDQVRLAKAGSAARGPLVHEAAGN